MNRIKLFNIIIALLFATGIIAGQESISDIRAIKEIDSFIDTAMQRWDVPGLAIGVIKDGNVIYSKGFGYKDLKTKEKVTTKTLFSIGSSSKAFTATLAAMAVEEKKMSFDTPLENYFPDFKMYDSLISGKVTLRDLLTHRTGIPRQKFFSLNPPADRRDVRRCFRYFEPNLDFRTLWQYCNEAYTVAGDMIAEREGTTSWEDLIRKRILDPLEMKSTQLSFSNIINKTDCATPYIIWDKDPEKMEFHNAYILGAAGCIISNVDDMLKWVEFNLSNGKVHDSSLISPRSLQQLQSPQVVIPGQTPRSEISYANYGMGWMIDYYRGYLHIYHGGVLYGFTSKVTFMPKEKIGIVILANLNGTPFVDVLERFVMDKLLKLDPIDWQQKALALYEAQMKQILEEENNSKAEKVKVPALLLEQSAGTYVSKGYGSLCVKVENDSLKVKVDNYDCPLNYMGEDAFELYHPAEHAGWKTVFLKDMNNRVNALSVEVSPNTKPVVFQKQM